MISHPQIAYRDCSHCQIYQYDEEIGQPYEGRTGGFARRHAGCPAPCRTASGCPKGTPEKSKELNQRNLQSLEHYLGCKATGRFPDDVIVQGNAIVIAGILEQPEKKHRHEISALLKGILYG